MQYRHHLLALSKGVQEDTTIYFVVWWVLFECSSFDHFPKLKVVGQLLVHPGSSFPFGACVFTRAPARTSEENISCIYLLPGVLHCNFSFHNSPRETIKRPVSFETHQHNDVMVKRKQSTRFINVQMTRASFRNVTVY